MTSSPSITLQILSLDELVQFADLLAIEVAYRRAKAPLVEVLADVDQYELAELLNTPPRTRPKGLCRGLRLDDSGKAKTNLANGWWRMPAAAAATGDERRNGKSRPKASSAPVYAKAVSTTVRKPISTMRSNVSQLAAYIWSVAELLRGDFKQSQIRAHHARPGEPGVSESAAGDPEWAREVVLTETRLRPALTEGDVPCTVGELKERFDASSPTSPWARTPRAFAS